MISGARIKKEGLFLVCTWRHGSHVGVHNNSKNDFWEFDLLRYLSTDRKIYCETLQWTQVIYLKKSNITLVTKERLLNLQIC